MKAHVWNDEGEAFGSGRDGRARATVAARDGGRRRRGDRGRRRDGLGYGRWRTGRALIALGLN